MSRVLAAQSGLPVSYALGAFVGCFIRTIILALILSGILRLILGPPVEPKAQRRKWIAGFAGGLLSIILGFLLQTMSPMDNLMMLAGRALGAFAYVFARSRSKG